VGKKPPASKAAAGRAQSFICPLSKMRVGAACRIKQLSASPEIAQRLRELGFCEEQCVKLLSQQDNVICQVCNVRLGISAELADAIWVEPLHKEEQVA
jgi:Fe2+ transport system protein FeoA